VAVVLGSWRGALVGLVGFGLPLACGRTSLDVDESAPEAADGGSPATTGGTDVGVPSGGRDQQAGAAGEGARAPSAVAGAAGAAGAASRGGWAGAAGAPGELPVAGRGGAGGFTRGGAAGAAPCEHPRLVCGDECVDPANDARHCGACDAPCPLDFGCFGGSCRRLEPLSCDELVVDFPVWGYPSRGLDLRPYTSSTLHWIGCATDGCAPGEFYCEDTATTLSFGTETSILRSMVDLGDRLGDGIPDRVAGCATADAPADKYNAPTGSSDPEGVDSVDALCRTLGYSRGVLVRETTNFCPEPHAVDPNGTWWDSELASTSGAGAEYLCVLDAALP
jgi:hypothetical protein